MNHSKVILITGASSGIGKASAEYLSRRGHAVYGTSRYAQAMPPPPVPLPRLATGEGESEGKKEIPIGSSSYPESQVLWCHCRVLDLSRHVSRRKVRQSN